MFFNYLYIKYMYYTKNISFRKLLPLDIYNNDALYIASKYYQAYNRPLQKWIHTALINFF